MITHVLVTALVLATAQADAAEEPEEAEAPPDLLQNTGFEAPSVATFGKGMPDHWFCFASKPADSAHLTEANARTGSQSLRLAAHPDDEQFQGAAQEFEVQPGEHYRFTVRVMGDPEDRLVNEGFGQIHFEWRNDRGKEIARTYGPIWKRGLPTQRWEEYFVEADAPDEADSGMAVIMFYSKNSGGRGAFLVDDCELSSETRRTSSPPRQKTRRTRQTLQERLENMKKNMEP